MKLLVIGSESLTGSALTSLLGHLGIAHKALASTQINLLQKQAAVKALSLYGPSQVINVASYPHLSLAEQDAAAAKLCDELNGVVPAILAEVCNHLNIPLLQHSSSLVFDGHKVHPYVEEDPANPQSRYGRSKWYGERALREVLPLHVIVRTDWVFSAQYPHYFQQHIAQCKAQQGKLTVMSNRFCPTPAVDVARVLLAIAQQIGCGAEAWGTYHYAAQQLLSQEVFVEQILQEAAALDADLMPFVDHLQFTRLPVCLPFIANSTLNGQKLFATFGIKARSRNAEVRALLRQLY